MVDERSTPQRNADRRDRDSEGRARNARPRDASGRPLPRDADGVDRVPDDLVLRPTEALREAQRLLDENLPFQAHEVLEGTWKAAEESDRALWQGLAQLAVGLTHIQRGNANGAVSLLRRGAERIDPYRNQRPYDIDVAGLSAHAVRVANWIEINGLADLSGDDVRPRLRGHTAG